MKKAIFLIFIITFIVSCKKAESCADCLTFYFENPQPVNDSELDHFPNRFRGLYMNKDSTFIIIDKDRILEEYSFKFKIHKKDIDSLKNEFDLVNNYLISKHTKKKLDIRSIGDSLELTDKNTDTLFRFSYNQKAKRINSQLILSKRDSIFWKVKFLSLENNKIKFRNMHYPEDLKHLDSLTVIKSKKIDSLSYLISPTRSEFKKILKIKKLGDDQEYTKISK